ncbi:unnamed protein product, partial [Meganyctiphanes norvegica]
VSILQPQININNPEGFLDIAANGKKLGRIYIRLWGHMRRGQNFLQLCLGTFGISFKLSKLNDFSMIDSPGETIRGGEYMSVDNPSIFESKAILENLEWGGDHVKPRKRGLVLGSGGGEPAKDSLFSICTRDDISEVFQCPFGEVIDGLSLAEKAIELRSEDTKITDTGVVLIT